MGGRLAFPRGIFGVESEGARLPLGARLVLSVLWSYARWWSEDASATWVCPSASTVARLTGQDVRSVRRQTAALVSAGLISREWGALDGRPREGWRLVRVETPLADESPLTDGSPLTDESPMTEEADPDPSTMGGVVDESPGGDRADTGGLTDESPKDPLQAPDQAQLTIGGDLDLAPEPEVDFAAEVIAYLRDAVRRLTGDPKSGPRAAATNRDLVRKTTKREAATLEDWQRVIDAQLESVRRNPKHWKYLCLSTITRPMNWARCMDAPAPRGHDRGARHTPSNFADIGQQPERAPCKTIDEIPL